MMADFNDATKAFWYHLVGRHLGVNEINNEQELRSLMEIDTTNGSIPLTVDFETYANPTLSVTYNSDGTVASTVENGTPVTYTYNSDGTVNTVTRNGITRTYSYDTSGNVTGAI
jgi:YD repeat-containing protein